MPQIKPTRPEFPNPPKQVTVQLPDKRKVVKNQGQKGNQNFGPNYPNQYVPYQYQHPNNGNSKIPPYNALVGAAVAPGIVPLTYFPIPPNSFESVPTILNKPSKKKSGEHQGAQSTKKPERSAIPFISISVSPHQKTPNSQFQRDLISSNIENPLKSIYSPNQVPPANQAAYFSYLNTYSPNFYNENGFPSQNVQPIKHPNQFNPFNTPFSSKYPNGVQQQSNSELNLPNNVQNSFANQNPNSNSPFSGFKSTFPLQFYGNFPNTVSNSRPFEYYNDSEDSEEGTSTTRKTRQPLVFSNS